MLRKIPKAFPRRRSSGNVLEDTEPHEGFRVMSQNEVFERKVASESKKASRLSSIKPFTSPAQKARQQSFDEDSGVSNRGSNSSGTANSAFSRVYDNSSSSARFSSSSTLPSEQETGEDLYRDPRTFSIRGAARTFTFGNRSKKTTAPNSVKYDSSDLEKDEIFPRPGLRERSMTTTSAYSNAVTPKVDAKLELGLSDFGGGFDGLFDGVGKRKSTQFLGDILPVPPIPNITRSESEPNLPLPPKALSPRTPATPYAIHTDYTTEPENSPYSLNSPRSNDELMVPSPISLRGHGEEMPPPVPPHRQVDAFSFKNGSSSTVNVQDKDALIVSRSSGSTIANNNHQNSPIQRPPQIDKLPYQAPSVFGGRQKTPPGALFESEYAPHPNDSTPKAKGRQLPAVVDSGAQIPHISANSTVVPARNGMKVMNQAQFNSYRKQLESSPADSDSDSEQDDYDDAEEEQQRLQEMEKQRRKQEGNLAVYRQQMQKATAEKHKSADRLSVDRSLSQMQINVSDSSSPPPGPLNHANTLPIIKFGTEESEPSSPDEDVPLGVLMAHGFPNKNRPPNKPTAPGRSSSANSVIFGSNLSPGQPPTPGPTPGSRHSALPVFARHLPQDPYYGAGLVNPPNRESLTFSGNNKAASVYGGSNAGGSSSMRHTTLVNVIANEERAKAQRRGSPNAQAGFGPAIGMPQQMPQNGMGMNNGMMNMNQVGMGQMGMGQTGMGQMGLGQMGQMNMQGMPNGQFDLMAQLLANQQMLQQQMVQGQLMLANMLQGQPGQLPPQFAGMQQPNFPNQVSGADGRPQSIMSSAPQLQQRPQSSPMMQTPSIGGYTPSIAPSERSTIGRASRYRPVTMQVPDGNSTTSGQTLQAAQTPASGPSPVNENPPKPAKKGFLSVLKKRSDHHSARAEEDDEEGWGVAHNRKSKRPEQNSVSGLQGLYHGNL